MKLSVPYKSDSTPVREDASSDLGKFSCIRGWEIVMDALAQARSQVPGDRSLVLMFRSTLSRGGSSPLEVVEILAERLVFQGIAFYAKYKNAQHNHHDQRDNTEDGHLANG